LTDDASAGVPAENVDLGECMAALSREQLEMIIVQMIAKQPEQADLIFRVG